MPYYPESLMPEQKKDKTEDVPGNPFVINAEDVNKHDDEIRAIESFLGTYKPNFPVNFSGTSYPSGFSGFSGNPYEYIPPCSQSNMLQTIDDALAKIREIRNNMFFTTSGVVCIYDPRVSPSPSREIAFPTNWPTTTLVTPLSDDTKAYDSFSPLPILSYVQVNNVDNMPETGYISIINEVYFKWIYDDPIWRYTIEFSRFASNTDELKIRSKNIAGNVEVLRYSGIDKANKRLLNVKRRQLSSTSNPHFTNDLVFKGVLSLQVLPSLYFFSDSYGADSSNTLLYKEIHMYLRANGTIDGHLGIQTDSSYDNHHTFYASYQSQLIRSVSPMVVFDPSKGC